MKKLLSLAIAALLTFSCALTAFAAADDSATPDEAKTPVELKIIEPPSKTYFWRDVVLPPESTDGVYADSEHYYAFADKMNAYYFNPILDLSGAKFEVVYSDGTTEDVDIADCTAEVADPFNYGEVMRTALDAAGNLELDTPYEENLRWYYSYCDSLEKQIDREYTVNVSYKNLTATYTITTSDYAVDNLIMVEPEDPDDSSAHDNPFDSTGEELYEIVSITPAKLYYTKADVIGSYLYDGKTYYTVQPDVSGTKITIKDTKTGKLYTTVLNGTEFMDVCSSDVPSLTEPNQALLIAFVADVDDCFGITTPTGYNKNVDFTFNAYFNYQSTNDTATKGTVTNDNGTVQTGSPITTMLFTLSAVIAGGALFLSYRKKFEK
ncbi:Uncharacterised protein [uncultured Ruminococcus sp.]|nr:hypothetical protein [uncultured Ruminococcus sp.]SCJ47555.1 Uncharacterised protein [uncultured Ruminococcus sp.]